jgi:hypothetical protein
MNQRIQKFSFAEFHEMLKEYVADPKARDALARYDAERAAGRASLYETGSECATEANSDFIAVGWTILAEHGWLTMQDLLALEGSEEFHELLLQGNSFSQIARRLIRVEPESDFKERFFDIDSGASVLELLRLRTKQNSKYEIYDLPGVE